MKISFPHAALIAGCLSIAGMNAVLADDSETSAPPPPPDGQNFHHGGGPLTPDQWQELKKDREQVFSNNSDLKTQQETLRQQEKDLQEKIDQEVVKLDPNAAPLIAKLKAAHHHHGPPPDAGGGQ